MFFNFPTTLKGKPHVNCNGRKMDPLIEDVVVPMEKW